MAVFGIQTEKNRAAKKFMRDSHERLQRPSIITNPFEGHIVKVSDSSSADVDYYVVDIEPVYPKFYYMGLLGIFLALVFGNINAWLIPGSIIFLMGIFWNKFWFYIMLRLGLRKAGYKSRVRIVNNELLIRKMIKSIL